MDNPIHQLIEQHALRGGVIDVDGPQGDRIDAQCRAARLVGRTMASVVSKGAFPEGGIVMPGAHNPILGTECAVSLSSKGMYAQLRKKISCSKEPPFTEEHKARDRAS